MNKSNFKRTADWLTACGKQPGDEKNLSVQVAVHFEEIAELLDELRVRGSGDDEDALMVCAARLRWLSNRGKSGQTVITIHDRVRALDALCDGEVTANGVAFLAGFYKEIADRRVLTSNESKLNEDGTAVILPGGKIGKSPLYAPPFLDDLV